MKNVLQFLEETTSKNKSKTAIIEEDNKITYSELLTKSKRVGSYLCDQINQRESLGIFMEKGINAIISFFGTVYAGGFYILLNPELPKVRLEKIVSISKIKTILTDEKNYNFIKDIFKNLNILKIEEILPTELNENKLSLIRNSALDIDPLYANFTSGSTGEPKGVVVSHRSVIDFINVFTKQFNINNSDIIANQAPFDFDVSVKDIYSSIFTGSTLLIVPKKLFSAPTKLLDYICDYKATTLIWAVSALCLVTTFHGFDYRVPNSVNKVLFSGEVMPIKHIKQWIEKLPNSLFVNLYGPTEITCNCTYHVVNKNLNYESQIPIGRAFDNEEVFLLDNDNNLIYNKNMIGEICVKGTALSLGYYNNLEQTNISFIQNPLNSSYIDLIYKTGDLGYIGNDNELYFSGRKDFQIKHMGHRIELEEIESEINKIEKIERACCIYNHERNKLCAFYIGEISKIELREKLTKIFPIFMIPNVLTQIDVFPLNKNGKIDRKQLLLNLESKKCAKGEKK